MADADPYAQWSAMLRRSAPFSLVLRGLGVVLAGYAVLWAGLLTIGLLGLAPDRILELDTRNALAFTPWGARIGVYVWAIGMLAGVTALIAQRAVAPVLIMVGFAAHLTVFLYLTANPYYDGFAGYPNLALEIILLLTAMRAAQIALRSEQT